jgi:hypothetical protein
MVGFGPWYRSDILSVVWVVMNAGGWMILDATGRIYIENNQALISGSCRERNNLFSELHFQDFVRSSSMIAHDLHFPRSDFCG